MGNNRFKERSSSPRSYRWAPLVLCVVCSGDRNCPEGFRVALHALDDRAMRGSSFTSLKVEMKPPNGRHLALLLLIFVTLSGLLVLRWCDVRSSAGDEWSATLSANDLAPITAPERQRKASNLGSPTTETTSKRSSSIQPVFQNSHIPPASVLSSVPSVNAMTEQARGARPENAMNCERADGGFRCGACTHGGECPPGQACVVNVKTGLMECAASECEEDRHCFPGSVCRVVERSAAGVPVRRCLTSGERGAGEKCVPAAFSPGSTCREELVCVDGVCGQRCTPGVAGGCPQGSICRESVSGAVTGDGAGCVPDCSLSGCTGALQCVSVQTGVHQCLRMMVNQCEGDQDCEQGQLCLTEWFGGKGGRYCAAGCESWRANSCPAGFVCGARRPGDGSSCYRECGGINACPTGFLCKTVTEDMQVWGCRVDYN